MATKLPDPALPRIYTIRRLKVVLDEDLARLYGVQTKRLNEAVRRNAVRFPADFCFSVTDEEAAALRSQSVTLKPGSHAENLKSQVATSSPLMDRVLRSQIATLKKDDRGKHRKYLPRVFTEHGALMAANILRSDRAVQMSLYLVRAFVQMRETVLANVSILKRLAEIDRRLIEHDSVLREVVERLQPLLNPPPEKKKPKIGFHPGNR